MFSRDAREGGHPHLLHYDCTCADNTKNRFAQAVLYSPVTGDLYVEWLAERFIRHFADEKKYWSLETTARKGDSTHR